MEDGTLGGGPQNQLLFPILYLAWQLKQSLFRVVQRNFDDRFCGHNF